MTAGNARILLGAHGEDIACGHLERAGYTLIERNSRCGRAGEIDIVARDGRCLVFCEVKTRVTGGSAGPDGPLDAIGPVKRKRIRKLAAEWLRTRPRLSPAPAWIRFDAVGIVVDRQGRLLSLDHVEDAF
ncbi:MAG TPA: YraN family protein [Thermoleophilaceae bacterium]|nr:YraN family protein [Thermoleophilaceae bacterium]